MGASAITPAAKPGRRPLAGVSSKLLRVAGDDRLVELVRGGSQPAFEVLYDRHHRGILSFCRHMLGSREEAEDALQHTFMAAYKSLLGSDGEIQLRAWLYTIARNRCLSVLRARREQPSDDIEIASTVGLAAEVEQREDLKDLLRDLAGLPEEQRAALVLSELGDLAHDDVAAILGCPREKVKALVFQARTSLHQSRDARETSCEDIREMLATLTGGALRRTELRRHVRDCAGCRAFESEIKRQRRAMAAVLPVVPTLGLRESALAAAFGQTAAGGAAVAGGAAAAAAGGAAATAGGGLTAVAAKVAVVAALAGGGAAGVSQVADQGSGPASAPSSSNSALAPAGGPAGPAAIAAPAGTPEAAEERREKAVEKAKKRKDASDERDGARGKELAETRGKGKKRGLRGTQPGGTKDKAARREAAETRRAQAKARRDAARRQRAEKKQEREKKPSRRPQRPAPQPKPEKPPKPQPTPEPTAEPTVVPTAEPTATPKKPEKSGLVTP